MGITQPRRAVLAAAVALLLPAACGGDGNETQDFCDELVAVNDDLGRVGQASPDQVAEIVTALEDLDPPGEIEDAYDNLLAVYRQIADGDAALTDPDLATEFANIESDIREIQNFTTEECAAGGDE